MTRVEGTITNGLGARRMARQETMEEMCCSVEEQGGSSQTERDRGQETLKEQIK